MFPFKGNINGTVDTTALELPTVINSFSLVNKSGSTVTANVYLISDYGVNCIMPLNKAINSGEMYSQTDRQIIVLASEVVRVQTSGSVDYNFTLDNLKAE